jgi:hypothetical protein
MTALEMGLSLLKGPVGGPGGGFVYRGFRERVEVRSVNAASLRGEPGRMAPLLGTLKAT